MIMRKIKINSDNGYLNMNDIPKDCIFNKIVTGCGGTTVVLFNEIDYVVAVPTTELITNKTGLVSAGIATITSPENKQQTVFALFGEFTYSVQKLLKEYVSTDGIKKIMCTYDKLDKVIRFINAAEWDLLVDEYHILLKAYSYRYKAISGVLNNCKSFRHCTFMSATPISPEFAPSALQDFPIVEAEWNQVDRLGVKLEQTNKPYVKAAKYIEMYKRDGFLDVNGVKSYEAFFFLNSVTDIASILEYTNLKNDEVRIICADNEDNRSKLEGYEISNSRSANKPFTFITSKSFEGVDYFSDTAVCFVVSNSKNKNTLLDISTDIYQIAGRIRTEGNPFRNLIIHIFNTSGKRSIDLGKTYEEMVQATNDEIDGAKEIISLINNSSDKAKKSAEKMLNPEYTFMNEKGDWEINDMTAKLSLYEFKIEQQIYKTGIALRTAYSDTGALSTEVEYIKVEGKLPKVSNTISFKEAFDKYCELKPYLFDTDSIKPYIKAQPLIVDAYKVLGEDSVKKMKYNKTKIQNAIINKKESKNKDYKAALMANKQVKLGFISSKQAKNIVTGIYKELDIADTPKGNCLEKWFEIKPVSKRENGKKVKGYMVMTPKFIIN